MKKIFIYLFIVMLFFGVIGCPSNEDSILPNTSLSAVDQPQVGGDTSSGDGVSPIPEPATLILVWLWFDWSCGIRTKRG